MNKSEIVQVINSMSKLGKILSELTYMRDEGVYILSKDDLSESLSKLAEKTDIAFFSLANLMDEYTGVSDNDFIGDGYFQMILDLFFNEDYEANTILEEFDKIDVVQQRHWVIDYNLDLLDEFNFKVKNNIEPERSRKIFDARFSKLLETTGVPDDKKLKYANLLLDYVNGKKSKEDVIERFEFYIFK